MEPALDLFLPPELSQHLRRHHLPASIFPNAARGAAAAADGTDQLPADAAAESNSDFWTQRQQESSNMYALSGTEAVAPMLGTPPWSASPVEGPPTSSSWSDANAKDPLLVIDVPPPRAAQQPAGTTLRCVQSSIELCPICLDACSSVDGVAHSRKSPRSAMVVSEDNEGDGGTLCLPG